MFPLLLDEAINNEAWLDPGSDRLRDVLGLSEDESDLMLFKSRDVMDKVKRDVDSGGYVDDPEFCMVRCMSDLSGPTDQRLVYTNALFVGGSKFPGDDVFLSIDLSKSSAEHMILWFDWAKTPPNRWTPIISLSEFLRELKATQRVGAKP